MKRVFYNTCNELDNVLTELNSANNKGDILSEKLLAVLIENDKLKEQLMRYQLDAAANAFLMRRSTGEAIDFVYAVVAVIGIYSVLLFIVSYISYM